MTSLKQSIPKDTRNVDSEPTTETEWEEAENGHEKLKQLVESKPEAKARYEAVLSEIHDRQMTLKKLRQARELTQSTLAELLEMDQSEVSRLESRSDMLFSTLRKFIEATGGEMHVVVRFPDGAPVELYVHQND